MNNSDQIIEKKHHNSKNKKVVITKENNGCSFLVYYDGNKIKKSKAFFYPQMGTATDKKEVDRQISYEYKLWLKCLWHYGYLEEDDSQLIEFKKTLDKKRK